MYNPYTMKRQGGILIMLAASLWAFDGVLRRSLYALPPGVIVLLEHVVGLIILAPFAYPQLKHIRLVPRDYAVLVLVAIFSGLLGTLWFTTALLQTGYASFSIVFLLQKLQPVFAVSTAVLILKEQIKKQYLVWASLTLGAAFFVTFPDGIVHTAFGGKTITASLYALGAAIVWGSSTTLSKLALHGKPVMAVTFLRFAFTVMFAFSYLMLTGGFVLFKSVVPGHFIQLTVIALSTGMVSLLLYYRGLKTTPVRIATILELVFPLLAVIIDMVVYHQFLTVSQIIAACILLFAVTRLNLARNAV